MSAPTTFPAAFQRTAARDPDAVAVRTVGDTLTLTWREYADRVRRVAAGLAGLGIGRGDTVASMMANRLEFYPLEVGAQHVGATAFSVYNTLTADQLGYVLGNSGARLVFCEARYVERVRASGAPVEHIVCVDDTPAGTLSVDDLIACAAPGFDFEATWRAVEPADIVTLIYTSGTTGDPKGVEMNHASLLFEVDAIAAVMPVEFGDRITSFLPTAHVADRVTALYLQEVHGTQITVVPDPTLLAAALRDCRPTIWAAVPRVWEKLKAAVELKVAGEPDESRRETLRWAMGVADRRAKALLSGGFIPREWAAEYAEADGLVLSKLRATLGLDRLRWAMSGAAPIPPETLAFFGGLGIEISEVWGMSELSCIASVVPPGEVRLGSVGPLLPGMESRIADDGEFLVRGPLVMVGYRGDPVRTAEAIDADGWLHTGDVMTQDPDGFLRVVDRKKELIINSAGKCMSPANIEGTMKAACPAIGGVVAIGDNRPYVTALVVLDAERAAAHAARHALPDGAASTLAAHPPLVEEVRAGIAAGNERLSRVEQIKRFLILPAFWEPGGEELTLTMKLRRKPIARRYAAEIDGLYAATPGAGVHEPARSLVAG